MKAWECCPVGINVPCHAYEVSRVLDPQCQKLGSVGVDKKQTLRRGRARPLQGISPPNHEAQQLKSGSAAGTEAPRRFSTIACRLTPLQCATAVRRVTSSNERRRQSSRELRGEYSVPVNNIHRGDAETLRKTKSKSRREGAEGWAVATGRRHWRRRHGIVAASFL